MCDGVGLELTSSPEPTVSSSVLSSSVGAEVGPEVIGAGVGKGIGLEVVRAGVGAVVCQGHTAAQLQQAWIAVSPSPLASAESPPNARHQPSFVM